MKEAFCTLLLNLWLGQLKEGPMLGAFLDNLFENSLWNLGQLGRFAPFCEEPKAQPG